GVVGEILVESAVQVVGSALGDDVHDAARGSSELGAVAAVDAPELLHRLLRRRSFLNAGSRRHVISSVDGDEVVVDILPGKGELGNRFDDDICTPRGRIADGDSGREQGKVNE